METEYEASFLSVDKANVRTRLREAGATLVFPERLMRRYTFFLPDESPLSKAWLRVRDEGNQVTMSIKQAGTAIEDQKELQITVDDFEKTTELLRLIGCTQKAYQETRRELWKLDGVEITIDEWPYLDPFIEIEGPSEAAVRNIAIKLGFDWDKARFCAVGTLYAEQYGIAEDDVNDRAPLITFTNPNPFQK